MSLKCKACGGAVHDWDTLCVQCFNISVTTYNAIRPVDAPLMERRKGGKPREACLAKALEEYEVLMVESTQYDEMAQSSQGDQPQLSKLSIDDEDIKARTTRILEDYRNYRDNAQGDC